MPNANNDDENGEQKVDDGRPVRVELELSVGRTKLIEPEGSSESRTSCAGKSQGNDPESISTDTPLQSSTKPKTDTPSKSITTEDEDEVEDSAKHKNNVEHKDNSEPEDKDERQCDVEPEDNDRKDDEKAEIDDLLIGTTPSQAVLLENIMDIDNACKSAEESAIESTLRKASSKETLCKPAMSEEELFERLKLKRKKPQTDKMGEIVEKLSRLLDATADKADKMDEIVKTIAQAFQSLPSASDVDSSDDEASDIDNESVSDMQDDEEQQDEDIANDIDVVDGTARTNGNEQNEVSEQARDEAEQPSGDTAEDEE